MQEAPEEQRVVARAGADDRRTGLPGCWRTGGIACGGCFLLFGVLTLVLIVAVGTDMGPIADGWRKLVFGCPPKLHGERGLQGALQRYRAREGSYPTQLLDLYPTFVTSRTAFHCPADPSPPSAVSYTYLPPAADAPADTILLICDHHTLQGARVRLLVPIEGDLGQEVVQLPPSERP